MNQELRERQRVESAVKTWADRNGLSLTHNALKQLHELIHTQVDIHRSEALSLAHEALPSFHRAQVVGRRIA